tara:strand:+ start:2689 stop:3426 length:738 start_codon:yes stop_codon:yes gene_type:complete
MKKIMVLILVTLGLQTQAINPPYVVGESYTYKINYGPINAGFAKLSIKNLENNIYTFEGKGWSNKFFDPFFKVRDTYISYYDYVEKEPIKFIRDVNEGGYIIKQKYTFDTKNNKVKTKKGEYNIFDNFQDMLSAFYYARSVPKKEILKDSIITLNIFMDEEEYDMGIKYIGNEKVKTKFGTLDCMVFIPTLQEGRIFKEEESMKIWITDDKNRSLIKVETEILVGTIKVMLYKTENVENIICINE